MKFMIAVDCDGLACVVGEPGRSLSSSRDMVFAREQATREADAAARALFDAGAEKVVVWDNHGAGANLVFDQLDSRCEILLGTGFDRRFPELDDSYSGVLMIGYHAMEGASNAVLAHAYSPWVYREICVNGQPVGEIALDAAVAGEFGVPLIFVSSDLCGCEEALEFMPWVETVVTKVGFGRTCARSKHPAVAERDIYKRVKLAVNKIDEMRPFAFTTPVRIEIKFRKLSQVLKARIKRRTWRLSGVFSLKTTVENMMGWKC